MKFLNGCHLYIRMTDGLQQKKNKKMKKWSLVFANEYHICNSWHINIMYYVCNYNR